MSTTCDTNYWVGSYVPTSGGGGDPSVPPIYRTLTCITTDAYTANCSTSLSINGVPVNTAKLLADTALLLNQTATASPAATSITGDGFRAPFLETGSLETPVVNASSAGGFISNSDITITGTSSFTECTINCTDATTALSQWFVPSLAAGNSANMILGAAATSGNAALVGSTVDPAGETTLTMGIYRGSLTKSSVTPRIDQRYNAAAGVAFADVVPRFTLKSNGLVPRRTWPSGATQLTAAGATQYVRFTLTPVVDMKRIILLFYNIKKAGGSGTTGVTCPCVRISSTTTAVSTPANYIGTTMGNQAAAMTNWNDGGSNGGIMLWNNRDFTSDAGTLSYTGVVEFTRNAPREGSITDDWWTVSGSVVSSVSTTTSRPYFSMLSGQVFLSNANVSNIFLTSYGTSPGTFVPNQGYVNILWY